MKKKIAVLFPGIGYHTDKPLLYYSRALVRERGYEVIEIRYGQLPSGVKGNPEKMREAFEQALKAVEAQLKEVCFDSCEDILFISKSMGTALAASYAMKNRIAARQVYYTPVKESFEAIGREGIVFHGTADSWADTEVICEECKKRGLPLYLTEGANHSMETGDTRADLRIMQEIMERTAAYIDKRR